MISLFVTPAVMILTSFAIFKVAMDGEASSSAWIQRLKKTSNRLTTVSPVKLGIGFLVLMSLMLWLIFISFTNYPNAVKVLYIFSITSVSFTVQSMWMDRYFKGFWVTAFKVTVSIFLGLSWVYHPHWLVYNLVGVIGAIALIVLFPNLSYKQFLALGIAIVIYDIVGVYLTGWIVSVVKSFTFMPPAVLMIPTEIASNPNVSIIGLGDIFIGGIFMVMAYQYGAEKVSHIAYASAIILSLLLAQITNYGVPATMFIVPLMLLATRFHSQKNGVVLI